MYEINFEEVFNFSTYVFSQITNPIRLFKKRLTILSNLEWMCRVELMTVFLEFPITVIERANLTSFQPPRDTMEMKCMVAHSPSHGTFFWGYGGLISLAFNAQIHDVVSTNGTIVDNNVPSPQCYSIPFFDFESKKKMVKSLKS